MRTYSSDEEAQKAENVNTAVKEWTSETLALIKSSVVALGVIDTTQLLRSLKYVIKKELGMPSVLSLKQKRHGLMQMYGVGRGVKAATQANSKRSKRDYYSPIIKSQLPKLEERLLQINADFILNTYPIDGQ